MGRGDATTYSFLMLAESSMDDTDVEEDLAGIMDFGKLVQRVIEFIVVVSSKGCDPSLDFLEQWVNGLNPPTRHLEGITV